MKRTVNFNGKEMTLKGIAFEINDDAPDFRVIDRDLNMKTIADFEGKVKLISTFPSLDTSVCSNQIKEFNQRALSLSDNVNVIGISMDLPFAMTRFCEANDINKMVLLSDYKYTSFGLNYGLLIKELHLLTRSVIIVDELDIIRYAEIVPEVTSAPDYDRTMDELDKVIKSPKTAREKEMTRECLSCCEGAAPLTPPEIKDYLSQLRGWELVDNRKIVKDYHRKSYRETKDLLDDISVIAEEQGHHPTSVLGYDHLKVVLSTYAVGELTENDFVMANLIDDIAEDSH